MRSVQDQEETLAALDDLVLSGQVVPEPETYALIVGALALVMVVVRKKLRAFRQAQD